MCLAKIHWLTAAGALVLAACAGSRSLSDLPVRVIAGHYTAAPDGHWFRPCSVADGEMVWVTFTDRSVTQRRQAPFADLLQSDTPLFVRWTAAMGDRTLGDPAGPGPGTKYVLVREIIEVRPAEDGDCSAPEVDR